MGTHVLVPVDDSGGSWKAFKHAVTQYPEDRITVLYVMDPGKFNPGTNTTEEQAKVEETLTEQVASICENAGVDRDRITIQTKGGKPPHTIVQYASTNDVDQIVMGSRGLSDMDKLLLGSVAETVVRRSEVPVNVIR